ncbi:hypothetical protein [Variovorax terrae]|uniref:DUF4124 domain-containing protein n=1 Tax=Variovorax terrae TaxID=2923278 RepID=A0A9X1VXS2_9BURK|nr:hypothetical protein [Variovorax terrae]MCJ0765661.1 hypothetical protein [Variovorax terrae]
MGLQDRDYVRERRWRDLDARPRPFAPPEPTLQSTLQIILFWLAVGFVLWKAWGWWEARQPAKRQPPSTATVSRPAVPPPRGPAALTYPSPTVPAAPKVVTRCVVNGVTSYSDAGCASATAPATHLRIDPAQNLADGMRPEHRAAALQSLQPRQQHVVQAAPQPVYAYPDLAVQLKAVCQGLEEEISYIDARARQPQPAWEQDRLSARRKVARDEQFRLRC